MKLPCNVAVGNRSLPPLTVNSKRQHIKSTLALCKNPKGTDYCVILFSTRYKNGNKYKLNGNVKQVLTRFVNEGKVTIQFINPQHDLYIQADSIQLKGFLHLLQRSLTNKVLPNEHTYSTMSVTPIAPKDIPPKKLTITKRSDYPIQGFPRTLEQLYINDIRRSSLDQGILQLVKLRVLDLSRNCLTYLPKELDNLPLLCDLNLSENELGKGRLNQWRWLGGSLSKSLRCLNLRNNELKFLPNQIGKLQNLVTLDVQNNELTTLPSCVGNFKRLKVLIASNNLISTLPGSVTKWKLQTLDLTHNRFDLQLQHINAVAPPKPLPVCSLREYASKNVLNLGIPYAPDIIPLTVVDYLDNAKYCVCGKACFETFIWHKHMLLLMTVAESVYFTNRDGSSFVAIDCYFCSPKCFVTVSFNRSRNPVI